MDFLEEAVEIDMGCGLDGAISPSKRATVRGIEPVIVREAPSNPIDPTHMDTGSWVLERYRAWVRRACRDASEPDTYGETVTADVTALLSILERINLGVDGLARCFRGLAPAPGR